MSSLDQLDELVDDGAGLADMLRVALQRQPVAAQRDRAAEPLAQRVEHAVADPGELGRDLVGDFEHLSQVARLSRRRPRRDLAATVPLWLKDATLRAG